MDFIHGTSYFHELSASSSRSTFYDNVVNIVFGKWNSRSIGLIESKVQRGLVGKGAILRLITFYAWVLTRPREKANRHPSQ